MQYLYPNGLTSVILRLKIRDATSILDAGLTGLTSASAGLIISTITDNEAAATVYTQAGSTIEAVTTIGTYAAPTATKCRIKLVDNTNHPGLYELQFADARFAVSGAKELHITITGPAALNIVQEDYKVQLASAPADLKLWLTVAPNALVSSRVDVSVGAMAAAVLTATAIAADAITDAKVAADVTIASVTGSVGSVTGAVGSVTGAVGSVTGNVGGNVVGSVASVVGAVGSVTGNVGGNVVGSVGSVVGAVGSVTADVGVTQAAADKVFGASGAAMTELAQAQPSATPSPRAAMMLLYMSLRNAVDVTATQKQIANDAGTVIAKKALSDDGTDYIEAKMVSGP